MASELEFYLEDTVDLGRKQIFDFNAGKINLSHFTSGITLMLLIWKWMELFLKKKTLFKMQELSFSSKLDWSSYIYSIAETASEKIGALIFSMKSLSFVIALYLYKSTIWPLIK